MLLAHHHNNMLQSQERQIQHCILNHSQLMSFQELLMANLYLWKTLNTTVENSCGINLKLTLSTTNSETIHGMKTFKLKKLLQILIYTIAKYDNVQIKKIMNCLLHWQRFSTKLQYSIRTIVDISLCFFYTIWHLFVFLHHHQHHFLYFCLLHNVSK